MRVLALDLATKLGWACGSAEGTPVSHGVIALPKTGEDCGRFGYAFREWLGHAIEELAPSEIIYESPVMFSKTTSLQAARKLYGLAFLTELVCLDYKVPVSEANLSDIRKHFIGIVRAPLSVPKDKRRQWIKGKIIAACRERGFKVAGDDDADAIALLDYALAVKKPSHAMKATPLLREIPA